VDTLEILPLRWAAYIISEEERERGGRAGRSGKQEEIKGSY
jgi:hypothetical protein